MYHMSHKITRCQVSYTFIDVQIYVQMYVQIYVQIYVRIDV